MSRMLYQLSYGSTARTHHGLSARIHVTTTYYSVLKDLGTEDAASAPARWQPPNT